MPNAGDEVPVDPDRYDEEPVDPDRGPEPAVGGADRVRPIVLAAIAAGGALGAAARYGAGQLWPDKPGSFAWTTVAINLLGCLLIGVLMPVVVERGRGHPLLRPLLGTGVLGGFTTFSTYATDTQALLAAGRWAPAVGYVLLTLLGAVGAVLAGQLLGRRIAAAPSLPVGSGA